MQLNERHLAVSTMQEHDGAERAREPLCAMHDTPPTCCSGRKFRRPLGTAAAIGGIVLLSVLGVTNPLVAFFAGVLAVAGGLAVGTTLSGKPSADNSSQLAAICDMLSQTVESPPVSTERNTTPTGRLDELVRLLKLERDTLLAQHHLITTHIAASVIIRDMSGQILFCSPYTQVLTGYSLEEIYQSDSDFLARIVVEEDRDRYLRAQMVSALAEDISVKYRIVHKSGLRLWLETRLVPVCDDNGELVSIMAVAIDVTESLSYQQQIEEQNRDLGDFAYMVSHDLKAPIFTIKGMASALSEDYATALGNDGQQLLQYIIDASKRLEQLVGSVIEYSAVATKEVENESVQLAGVVKSVCDDLSELSKQKQADIVVEGELPTVRGNSVRLYQVFANLVGNALKYSSSERKPRITIRRRRNLNGMVTVDVSDNGLGIPAAKVGDVFRPYFRAHGKEIEGNGIGLACVKKIMDRLGGIVTVTSIEGQGSTFSVSFPSATSEAREIPADLARCFEQ